MAGEQTVFLLYEVGLLIIVCSIVSGVFKRLNLPGLIGAILVGLFIGGPGGLGLVTDLATINFLAVLGVVLLLFTTGLEFEVSAFWKLGRRAFLLTTIGVLLSLICGYGVGLALGLPSNTSFLLGAVISPSGTSVVAALLSSNKLVRTQDGSALLTACVLDDVEGLIILTVALSVMASGVLMPVDLLGVSLISTTFIVGSILLGGKLLPRVIVRLEGRLSDETLFPVLLGLGLVFAFAATSVGLAAVTGAFIVGTIIPYKPVGENLARQLEMTKGIFTAVFFASIGLAINPFDIPLLLPMAVVVLVVAIGARLGGGLVGGRAAGLHGRILLSSTLGLAVRGEMSLIIAREAFASGYVGTDFLTLTTIVVIGSIFVVMPLFSKMAQSLSVGQQEDLRSQ